MVVLQTEYDFTLPRGYVDEDGNLHKNGKMRLSTAADEILPMKDPRVQGNPAYLTVILLSRVLTSLGSLNAITPKVIEGLFSSDFTYLQEMYARINQNSSNTIAAVCPRCEHKFDIEVKYQGE
jgi:hypothetical protein